VVLTVANVLAEAENVVATLAITSADRIYAPVPIFHSYGFDLGVLPMLTAGAGLVLRETFVPRRVLAEVADPAVTIFLGVPSIYRTFVETPLATVPDLSHLRYLLSCTAPLRPELIAAFHAKFRMPICQHYGSSETGAVTTHLPDQVLAHPASVGRPMANVQLIIRDKAGTIVPTGGQGEVTVRSKVVAPGYLMGHVEGESRFHADTYRTGDIGSLDSEGFLHLHGRLDDVINVGGLKVSPLEVVQALEAHPAVREASVAGAKNGAGEEYVYAAVTLQGSATESELLQHCRARLSEHKVPRRIDILEEMPRGASGKIKLNPKDVQS
jgi:acyl-coenzyme A synthetase/AMP-(fatty) acid ligase